MSRYSTVFSISEPKGCVSLHCCLPVSIITLSFLNTDSFFTMQNLPATVQNTCQFKKNTAIYFIFISMHLFEISQALILCMKYIHTMKADAYDTTPRMLHLLSVAVVRAGCFLAERQMVVVSKGEETICFAVLLAAGEGVRRGNCWRC